MADEPLRHTAVWTDDCQGKKDFDGEAVAISTRYRPGYSTVFDTAHPEKGFHQVRSGNPAALAGLALRHRVGEPPDDYVESLTLAERRFEGDTEADVRRQVEAWVQEQFERLATALRREFGA